MVNDPYRVTKEILCMRLIFFLSLLWAWQCFAVELSFSCGSVGLEFQLCQQNVAEWEKKTGHHVRMVSAPKGASARLALYQQQLSAKSEDLDVFQADIVWPGILAPHLLDLKPYFTELERQDFFETAIDNNTVDNRLVALPWSVEAGLLFYRKDLLEKYDFQPPKSWPELTKIALSIQQQENQQMDEKIWGMVFQGRAYEGLTCNALEWINGFGGGTIVDETGNVTVNNPQAVKALTMVQQWINPKDDVPAITPYSVLNYTEEDVRSVFQGGQAVFMRNWPYAWPLLNAPNSPVKGKVGIMLLPAEGGENNFTGTMGGQHLSISRYTKHPEIAIDLIRFLTSDDILKRRAMYLAKDPAKPRMYKDPDIMDSSAHLPPAYQLYQGKAVNRPSSVSGIHYNQVSTTFWNGVHQVIAGTSQPKQALREIEHGIQEILDK